MDERQLEQLARDIDELKIAVRRNDPLIRQILNQRGWFLLALWGGVGIALFALPAHFLSRAYGGFESIPLLGRALLWAALALVFAGGGLWKLLLIARRAGEVDSRSSVGDVLDSFFGVNSIHVTGAMLAGIASAVAFAFWAGSPWHAVPATGLLMGIWMNAIGAQTRVREYLVSGWWSVLSGAAGLFLVGRAPFLWVFLVYGGMFFAFAAAIALSPRRPEGRPSGRGAA